MLAFQGFFVILGIMGTENVIIFSVPFFFARKK